MVRVALAKMEGVHWGWDESAGHQNLAGGPSPRGFEDSVAARTGRPWNMGKERQRSHQLIVKVNG